MYVYIVDTDVRAVYEQVTLANGNTSFPTINYPSNILYKRVIHLVNIRSLFNVLFAVHFNQFSFLFSWRVKYSLIKLWIIIMSVFNFIKDTAPSQLKYSNTVMCL